MSYFSGISTREKQKSCKIPFPERILPDNNNIQTNTTHVQKKLDFETKNSVPLEIKHELNPIFMDRIMPIDTRQNTSIINYSLGEGEKDLKIDSSKISPGIDVNKSGSE